MSNMKCVKPLQLFKLQKHEKIELVDESIAIPTSRNIEIQY